LLNNWDFDSNTLVILFLNDNDLAMSIKPKTSCVGMKPLHSADLCDFHAIWCIFISF